MNGIQRYTLDIEYENELYEFHPAPYIENYKMPDGKWCKYSDVEAALSASPWIKCSDRLPVKEDLYFTKGADGDFDTDWFDPKDEETVRYFEATRSKWMEIPK